MGSFGRAQDSTVQGFGPPQEGSSGFAPPQGGAAPVPEVTITEDFQYGKIVVEASVPVVTENFQYGKIVVEEPVPVVTENFQYGVVV